MSEFLFLSIKIANGIAPFNRSVAGDCAGSGEQSLGQCRLAGCAMTDESNGANVDGGVVPHVIS